MWMNCQKPNKKINDHQQRVDIFILKPSCVVPTSISISLGVSKGVAV
jgi:hypothetical protein